MQEYEYYVYVTTSGVEAVCVECPECWCMIVRIGIAHACCADDSDTETSDEQLLFVEELKKIDKISPCAIDWSDTARAG